MNAQLKVSGNIVRGIGLAIMAIVLVVSAAGPGGALAQPSQAPASLATAELSVDKCPTSDTVPSDIVVKNVTGLFSVDLRLTFDPKALQVSDIIVPAGSVFAPPAVVGIKTFDNATGKIRFVATRENDSPGPFSGDRGVLFKIVWSKVDQTQCDGRDILTIPSHQTPVPPNPPQLSDRNGMDIPYTAASPCKPDCGCRISGKVLLQGHTDSAGQRPDYSGTDIMLSTDRDCPTNFTYSALWDWPGVLKAKTAADGSFTLPKAQTCKCLYAFKRGYLTALGQGPYPYTGTFTMTDIILRGGDATQDDAINIFDLTLIASHYGESHPANAEAALADINGDNKVDIYDLALAAGNSGVARGPQKWSR